MGKRNERKRGARVWNTAGFHNLISTWSSLLDSWNLVVSKVERDTTTTTTHLPVKFVFERGRGVDIEQFSNCLAQRLCIIVPVRVSKDEGLLRFVVDWERRRFIY